MRRDFDELRLRQRRGHPQDRLIGKENRALGHRMHIAGEAKLAQVVEQIPAEPAGGLEPFEFRRREAKVFEVVERLLEAGRKEKAAAGGQAADEEFENGGFRLAVIQVGLHHVDLIKVGQQCARALRIHRLSLVFGPEPSANSARHRAGGNWRLFPRAGFHRFPPLSANMEPGVRVNPRVQSLFIASLTCPSPRIGAM